MFQRVSDNSGELGFSIYIAHFLKVYRVYALLVNLSHYIYNSKQIKVKFIREETDDKKAK